MIRLPISQSWLMWLYRFGLLVAVVAVTWLALTSTHVKMASLVSDKINHGFAFFVLAWLIDNAFPQQRFLKLKLWPLLGYGVAIEIVQRFAARDASLLDLGADVVGISLYWLIRSWARRLVLGRSNAAA